MAEYIVSKEEYKIVFSDHKLDTVYGQIGLTDIERKLEKLPLFKRLHDISQLGLTKLIFPCAVHTRYVHSIGVMHTAYNMAMHINANTVGVQFDGHQGPFFSDAELQIIRLAGLLHDIGHYPLSHNIEAAYKDGAKYYGNDSDQIVNRQKDLVGCPEFCAACIAKRPDSFDDDYLKDFTGSVGFHHETIGKRLIENNKEIYDQIRDSFVLMTSSKGEKVLNPCFKGIGDSEDKKYTDEDINTITQRLLSTIGMIVIGNYDNDSEPSYDYEYEKKYSAMIQLIHSDLDADNLDYLLRDATFSGTSYGQMDVNALLNCLTVAEIKHDDYTVEAPEDRENSPQKTRYIVGVTKKGVGCVEQFFQNKYLAYNQMIYSKYVSALEAMLLYWAKNNLPQIGQFTAPGITTSEKATTLIGKVNCEDTDSAFLHFTDAYVMQQIYLNYQMLKNQETTGSVTINPTIEAILSQLNHFHAFPVDDSVEECICVGLCEQDIIESLRKEPLYNEYKEYIEKIQDKTIEDIKCKEEEKGLLSYRFEYYSMTKQIPIDVFIEKYAATKEGKQVDILKKHYYRLASGVPIIKKQKEEHSKYSIQFKEDGSIAEDLIPPLVVDSSSSSLHRTWNQKILFLRKYKVEPFKF